MTVDEALRSASKRLSAHSSTPRLDAELLLGHLLQMSRAALLARATCDIEPESVQSDYGSLLARRELGEPIAYIIGHKEFYGLDLTITKDALVPRPETEGVVDICLAYLPESEMSQLADVGTGSGAIAIAVAANRPTVQVIATDISGAALEVARQNTLRYGLQDRIKLAMGDLLEPVGRRVNVIAANLPYVSPGEAASDVASWEPTVAVFGGGDDGMTTIRRFLQQAPDYLLPGGVTIMEVAYSQGQMVRDLAMQAFPNGSVEVRKDLAGYDRIVIIESGT